MTAEELNIHRGARALGFAQDVGTLSPWQPTVGNLNPTPMTPVSVTQSSGPIPIPGQAPAPSGFQLFLEWAAATHQDSEIIRPFELGMQHDPRYPFIPETELVSAFIKYRNQVERLQRLQRHGVRLQEMSAQVQYDPAIYDPRLGYVVYRRNPKGLSTRRMLNDARILQNFGQWEALVGSLVSGVSSIGSAAVAAALAPHPAALATATAPPPRSLTAASAPVAPQTPGSNIPVFVIPQPNITPPAAGSGVSNPDAWLQSPAVLVGGGLAFLALLLVIMNRK